MTNSIDGVDRALPRYRQYAHTVNILRHAKKPGTTDRPMPSSIREPGDRKQVLGIPLFIQRTPPWRRQEWDQPQTPPTRETV